MDESLRLKINWCAKVIRASGKGEIEIVIDNRGIMYNVIKNGRIVFQSKKLESFESYCVKLIERSISYGKNQNKTYRRCVCHAW